MRARNKTKGVLIAKATPQGEYINKKGGANLPNVQKSKSTGRTANV